MFLDFSGAYTGLSAWFLANENQKLQSEWEDIFSKTVSMFSWVDWENVNKELCLMFKDETQNTKDHMPT